MAIDIEAQVDRILEDAREELLAVVRAEAQRVAAADDAAESAESPAADTPAASVEPQTGAGTSPKTGATLPDHPPRVSVEHERPFIYDYPSKTPDGRFVPVSWVGPIPGQSAITADDIAELADVWNIDPCHLRAGRWAAFAKDYNGPGFRKNRYDEKLAAAARRCR